MRFKNKPIDCAQPVKTRTANDRNGCHCKRDHWQSIVSWLAEDPTPSILLTVIIIAVILILWRLVSRYFSF